LSSTILIQFVCEILVVAIAIVTISTIWWVVEVHVPHACNWPVYMYDWSRAIALWEKDIAGSSMTVVWVWCASCRLTRAYQDYSPACCMLMKYIIVRHCLGVESRARRVFVTTRI
jgi:hypothetical protein